MPVVGKAAGPGEKKEVAPAPMVLKLGGKPMERGCRQTGEWGGRMSKEDLGLSPWRTLKEGKF